MISWSVSSEFSSPSWCSAKLEWIADSDLKARILLPTPYHPFIISSFQEKQLSSYYYHSYYIVVLQLKRVGRGSWLLLCSQRLGPSHQSALILVVAPLTPPFIRTQLTAILRRWSALTAMKPLNWISFTFPTFCEMSQMKWVNAPKYAEN